MKPRKSWKLIEKNPPEATTEKTTPLGLKSQKKKGSGKIQIHFTQHCEGLLQDATKQHNYNTTTTTATTTPQHSAWNEANIITGWTDVDLNENGKQEAIEARKCLIQKGFGFDTVITSVLRRAVQTASTVCTHSESSVPHERAVQRWHFRSQLGGDCREVDGVHSTSRRYKGENKQLNNVAIPTRMSSL